MKDVDQWDTALKDDTPKAIATVTEIGLKMFKLRQFPRVMKDLFSLPEVCV